MSHIDPTRTPARELGGLGNLKFSQTDPHKVHNSQISRYDQVPNTDGRATAHSPPERNGALRRILFDGQDSVPLQYTSLRPNLRGNPKTDGRRSIDQVVPSFSDFSQTFSPGEFSRERSPVNPSEAISEPNDDLEEVGATEMSEPPGSHTPVEEPHPIPDTITDKSASSYPWSYITVSIKFLAEFVFSVQFIGTILGAVVWALSLGWFLSNLLDNKDMRYLYQVFHVLFGGFFVAGMIKLVIQKDEEKFDIVGLAWGFTNPVATFIFSLLNQPVLVYEIFSHVLKDKAYLGSQNGMLATNIGQAFDLKENNDIGVDLTDMVYLLLVPPLICALCISITSSFYLLEEKTILDAIKKGHTLFACNYLSLIVLAAFNYALAALPYETATFAVSLGFIQHENQRISETVALITSTILITPIAIPFVYRIFKEISRRKLQ